MVTVEVNFPLDQTFILSVWLEVLLYGAFFPLFWAAVYVLLRRGYMASLNKPMLFAAILMFLLATTHLSINLYRLLQGYVFQRDRPGGPVGYFSDLSNPTHVAKDTIYATQSLIGDAFNIYRCWVVWNHNIYVVALPLVLLICSIFSGYVTCSLFVKVGTDASIFASSLNSWILTFYSIAFIQNTLTTSLIAFRIWKTDRETAAFRSSKRSSLLPTILIVLESALIYALAELVLLILYTINDNAQYIVLETITPIVGLVFCSIIVRVGLHAHNTSIPTMPTRGTNYDRNNYDLPMRPLAVTVKREQLQEGGYDQAEDPGKRSLSSVHTTDATDLA